MNRKYYEFENKNNIFNDICNGFFLYPQSENGE